MTQYHIIFFDGECMFCNGWVEWIAKRDPRKLFKFCSLHSNTGRAFLAEHKQTQLNTIYVVHADQCVSKSDAILYILKELGGIWKVFLVGKVIPKLWRDKWYDCVARNRYRWNKDNACPIPSNRVKERLMVDDPR